MPECDPFRQHSDGTKQRPDKAGRARVVDPRVEVDTAEHDVEPGLLGGHGMLDQIWASWVPRLIRLLRGTGSLSVPKPLPSNATWEYLRIRPPSRSRRRTRTCAPRAGGWGCPMNSWADFRGFGGQEDSAGQARADIWDSAADAVPWQVCAGLTGNAIAASR